MESEEFKNDQSVQKTWEEYIGSVGIPENILYMLRQFFIPDKIDPQKYANNLQANEAVKSGFGLEIMEQINSEKINCTPTFRKQFANDTSNRGIQAPDWFYEAYPDVAYWLINNMLLFEKLTNGREHEFIQDGRIKDTLFREMINYYRSNVNNNLECSIRFKKEDFNSTNKNKLFSTDMTSSDAIMHIKNTPLKDLMGFICDEEMRFTILKAWELKKEGKEIFF